MKSKFEEEVYKQLVKKYGKVAVTYENAKIPYTLSYNYIPDFSVCSGLVNDGYILEAKGYFRPEARTKMRAVKEQHPELDLRLLFQNNGKIGKNFRYSDWAEKHDFIYAIGKIPKDW